MAGFPAEASPSHMPHFLSMLLQSKRLISHTLFLSPPCLHITLLTASLMTPPSLMFLPSSLLFTSNDDERVVDSESMAVRGLKR